MITLAFFRKELFRFIQLGMQTFVPGTLKSSIVRVGFDIIRLSVSTSSFLLMESRLSPLFTI